MLLVIGLQRKPEIHGASQNTFEPLSSIHRDGHLAIDELADMLLAVAKAPSQFGLGPAAFLGQIQDGFTRRQHPMRREGGTRFSHGSPQ